MALSALLYIGDNSTEDYVYEYKITSCRVKTARQHSSSVPESDPVCQEMDISIIAPDQDSPELYEWYANQDFISGKLVMDLSDQAALYNETIRTFKFDNARLHTLSEEYDIDGKVRHSLHLGLAVQTIEVDGVEFKSNFKY